MVTLLRIRTDKLPLWAPTRLLLVMVIILLFFGSPLLASPSQAEPAEIGDQRKISNCLLSVPMFKGIDLNKYKIGKFAVEPNQTISSILQPYGIRMPDVLKLCKTAKNVFDPRQMTAGQPYFIVRRLGQTPGVKYFILEKSIEDLVVFEFGSSPRVFTAKKALEKRTLSVSCKVRSSLWNTLKENQMSTDLIPKLEGLFDRRVDLSLLKPGDSLSVKYEEYYDAGHSVRVGPILAAKLTSGRTRVSAFRYSHCGTNGYFDENGNSLQADFLPSPLTNARITSGYSAKRKHPVTARYRAHPAIDFAAPRGTPVMSVGNGTITTLDYNESSGNFIKISHSSNYISQYLHLSGFAEGKKVGSKVIKGDVIGFVGDTGLTTGPHLDFRFTNDGKMVDYRKIDLPDGQPVNVACIDDYKLFIQQIFIDR